METLLEKVISLDFDIVGNGNRWRCTREHDSLVLDLQEQKWYWNKEDLRGGPLDYLILVKKMTGSQAKELLNDLICISAKDILCPTKGVFNVPNEKLVDLFWKNGITDRDYWYRRCLIDSTIDRFRLGKYDGYWMLPVYVDGKFMNFQCRTDIPEKKIRPWYRGIGPVLFNSSILPLTDKVFITEGPVDAILLSQLGFPAISHLGGSDGWKDEWFSYFRNQKEIFCIADNDIAGYNGIKKIVNSLGQYRVKIISFLDYPLKTDFIALIKNGGTTEEFNNLISKAVPGFMIKDLISQIRKREQGENKDENSVRS